MRGLEDKYKGKVKLTVLMGKPDETKMRFKSYTEEEGHGVVGFKGSEAKPTVKVNGHDMGGSTEAATAKLEELIAQLLK